MSFREKSAWITLVTVLACFGVYYGAIATGAVPARGLATIRLLLACAGALVVLQLVLHLAAAMRAPKEALAPRDERERQIQARSHTIGYYVLIALVLALGIPGHLGHDTVDLMNFALLDVVLAATAVSAAQIVLFRRGG